MPKRPRIYLSDRMAQIISYREWQAGEQSPAADWDLMRDCVEKLDARSRDLILAHFYEGLSYREMAERYGWANKGSAHWAVKQALRRLATLIEKERKRDEQ